MTGCRCCVFLTIFTLSVVFGKSFPKHVSLVKARFGDTLGYGAAGNRSRVQRLRRADLLVDPIRATGDSLAGHLCGLVSTRPLSSVSGFVLTSRHTARVSLEIVTSLSQALRTFELAPRAPRSVP
ncbi:unnamed protein product [Effrenium voratum]|uniref:Secreted protein n=1 Tax=Effrenium voratum TaxID=2562239 RepID=A0AA36IAC2_9DINO|nr:unnamed protein product [Effrenium voratum]